MEYLAGEHDVSQVLAQLASEEGAQPLPSPPPAADTGTMLAGTASEVNAPNVLAAASSVDDVRGLEEIPTAHETAAVSTPHPLGPTPAQTARQTTKPKPKNWFAKFGRPRTKK
ncbi:hypothetical protein HYPSUDRAFT_763829 [Hypholoma sublateritium FD-334 SS-4]|uniref:Uncharacterized protein n=1 Tax=Hypholoma sublateritium (strain FD-334 SS-4) TaxID=945553 RepID=A0A0D2NWS7_HYPSF|nr:hypothetical protein HYPSUDRAFT_763829 [Hypholoma sublateritium FD-334 SS-4]